MAKLGMVRIKGKACRTRRGRFTNCRKPISRGKGKGFAKRHTKGLKGRCVKWSKGHTRCVKRQYKNHGYPHSKPKAAGKGRCVKWSKGKTRCLKRVGGTIRRTKTLRYKTAAHTARRRSVKRSGKKAAGVGRCLQWSKGKTRCLKRIHHHASGYATVG